MIKKLQLYVLYSYINNHKNSTYFSKVIFSLFCWVGSVIGNLVAYKELWSDNFTVQLALYAWSGLCCLGMAFFIAMLNSESSIIKVSNNYNYGCSYNEIKINDRKDLLLFTFYSYGIICCSGAMFILLPLKIIICIGKVFVCTIPRHIIDYFIGDEPEKSDSKSTLQEYNEFITRK